MVQLYRKRKIVGGGTFMKFTCNRDLLSEGISIVQKAIPSKSNYPALECILIEVSEDLILTGSDGDISITYQVAAIIEEIGSLLVNARLFSEIIRKLPDVYVTIETAPAGNGIQVNSGSSHFEIPTISSEQYPRINFINNFDNSVELPADAFRSLVRQTAFAASVDSSKLVLRGVLMENKDGLLKFVAVDGLKLALKTYPNVNATDFKLVVPARVLTELTRILDKNSDTLSFCYSETQIMFYNTSFKLVCGLLKGEFPAYPALIPSDFSASMTVNTEQFIDTVERVTLVIDDEKKWPVEFVTYPDEVFISVAGENGNSHEALAAEIVGQEVTISFSKKTLLDCLKVVEKEKITFNFPRGKGACLVNSEDDDSFLLVIMPVKPRVR